MTLVLGDPRGVILSVTLELSVIGMFSVGGLMTDYSYSRCSFNCTHRNVQLTLSTEQRPVFFAAPVFVQLSASSFFEIPLFAGV